MAKCHRGLSVCWKNHDVLRGSSDAGTPHKAAISFLFGAFHVLLARPSTSGEIAATSLLCTEPGTFIKYCLCETNCRALLHFFFVSALILNKGDARQSTFFFWKTSTGKKMVWIWQNKEGFGFSGFPLCLISQLVHVSPDAFISIYSVVPALPLIIPSLYNPAEWLYFNYSVGWMQNRSNLFIATNAIGNWIVPK